MERITVGKLLEIWEESFTEGWNARSEKPWMDPIEAFDEWLEKESKKLLNHHNERSHI